jgi:hypothetical protein
MDALIQKGTKAVAAAMSVLCAPTPEPASSTPVVDQQLPQELLVGECEAHHRATVEDGEEASIVSRKSCAHLPCPEPNVPSFELFWNQLGKCARMYGSNSVQAGTKLSWHSYINKHEETVEDSVAPINRQTNDLADEYKTQLESLVCEVVPEAKRDAVRSCCVMHQSTDLLHFVLERPGDALFRWTDLSTDDLSLILLCIPHGSFRESCLKKIYYNTYLSIAKTIIVEVEKMENGGTSSVFSENGKVIAYDFIRFLGVQFEFYKVTLTVKIQALDWFVHKILEELSTCPYSHAEFYITCVLSISDSVRTLERLAEVCTRRCLGGCTLPILAMRVFNKPEFRKEKLDISINLFVLMFVMNHPPMVDLGTSFFDTMYELNRFVAYRTFKSIVENEKKRKTPVDSECWRMFIDIIYLRVKLADAESEKFAMSLCEDVKPSSGSRALSKKKKIKVEK